MASEPQSSIAEARELLTEYITTGEAFSNVQNSYVNLECRERASYRLADWRYALTVLPIAIATLEAFIAHLIITFNNVVFVSYLRSL